MIVCVCHGVSDRHIKAAIRDGATTVEALGAELGVATGCGCCREACGDLIAEHACQRGMAPLACTTFALMPA